MFTERTSEGLDVDARSVVAAAIDSVAGELFQTRLTPSHEHIRSWLRDLPGPIAVADEAGPTGFGLSRSLIAAGIRCEVVAPSKLQRSSGDRVKTDAKDAVHLASNGRSPARQHERTAGARRSSPEQSHVSGRARVGPFMTAGPAKINPLPISGWRRDANVS
jgi:transposase